MIPLWPVRALWQVAFGQPWEYVQRWDAEPLPATKMTLLGLGLTLGLRERWRCSGLLHKVPQVTESGFSQPPSSPGPWGKSSRWVKMGKLSLMSCRVTSTVAVPDSPRRPWASRASTTISYLACISLSKVLVVVKMSPAKSIRAGAVLLGGTLENTGA